MAEKNESQESARKLIKKYAGKELILKLFDVRASFRKSEDWHKLPPDTVKKYADNLETKTITGADKEREALDYLRECEHELEATALESQ